MFMHLYSATLFGCDGDPQLHYSGLRFTYTNQSQREQGPRAMFSNVVECKDKLFATNHLISHCYCPFHLNLKS
jgi:hypothetical protein